MEQLSCYIRLHSTGKAAIVMGDLNGRYSFGQDNVDWYISNGLPLSDHHPFSARFNWKLPEPTITFNT